MVHLDHIFSIGKRKQKNLQNGLTIFIKGVYYTQLDDKQLD